MNKQCAWPPGSADAVCPHPSITLTFDHLTLKLVCESHLCWGTFVPNLGTIGLWVLELFATRRTDARTDRQTDGQTDKSNAYCPFPTVGSIINVTRLKRSLHRTEHIILYVTCYRLADSTLRLPN